MQNTPPSFSQRAVSRLSSRRLLSYCIQTRGEARYTPRAGEQDPAMREEKEMEVATQTGAGTGSLITDEVLDGKIYSGGWQQTSERLEVHNPATGEQLASVGSAGRDDVLRASKLAAEAQVEWAAPPGPERARLLNATADALESARDECEWWLIREGGGVPQKA